MIKVINKIEKLKQTTFKGYEKHTSAYNVKKAFDWVCDNFTYDNTPKPHEDHTAYGGVIKGTTVCQGYATTIYALCKTMGVNARVVTSSFHAWNIVQIDGKYYNVDATWGDGYLEDSMPAYKN